MEQTQLIIEEQDLSKCSMEKLRSIAKNYCTSGKSRVELIKNIQRSQMGSAIRKGNLEQVQHLYQSGVEINDEHFEAAVYGGLKIIEYFIRIGVKYSPSVMDVAALKGNLEMVKYLHEVGKDCSIKAMDWAAREGNLEMVKYLHSIGKDCTWGAMDWAARSGHLEMVEYLHSIGKDCTWDAMDNAVMIGLSKLVKYLHSINAPCRENIMDVAIRNNDLNMVQLLHSLGKTCNPNITKDLRTQTSSDVAMIRYLESIGVKISWQKMKQIQKRIENGFYH